MKSLPAPSYLTNFTSTSDSGYIIAKIIKLLKVLLLLWKICVFAATGRRPYCFFRKPINTIPMKSVLFKHRSIRKFRSTPIPEDVLHEILEAASRASTCGNMQLYSLVVTRDAALRGRLAPCHFNQPMVTQAPCVVTVCAERECRCRSRSQERFRLSSDFHQATECRDAWSDGFRCRKRRPDRASY